MAPKRVLPPVYFFTALLSMVGLHLAIPIRTLIPPPYSYFGAAFVAGGLLMVMWAAGLFHKVQTPIKPFEQSTHLVTVGPFKYSRNPMYLGMLGVLTGVFVLLGSVTPIVAIPILYWVLTTKFIAVEERSLEETFGEEYVSYKKKVRRWL